MTISLPRSLILGLTLALAACGGEGLTLPPDGAAANIEVMSGNGQSARVGSTLPESLVVKVTDTQDRPVAGADVAFEFTADGSTATPATASTDADGIAWSRLVLGTRVGPVAGTVKVPVGSGIAQAAITATALSDDANGIAIVSGNDQSGAVGTALSAPLVVVVADKFGNPIPNVTVEWSIPADGGGGSVSLLTTVTGDNGQASVTRTLGPTAGPQTTLATAVGLVGSPVKFTHTATAGSASRIEIVSGDNQSALVGSALSLPLVVRVLDEANNPIQGRAVTWVPGPGDGTATPQNTVTDELGQTNTQWTLGDLGPNTLNAVASGVQTSTVTFSATATSGTPSASTSMVSASPTTINTVTGSSTITVTVRDAGNNPVAGVSVTPASSGSGNTFDPASASTGANGVATFTFSSTVAESKTITATAGGVLITDQATVNVQKVSSTVEITSDDNDPSTVGQNVTVEFIVSGSGGTPTGNVVITISNGLPNETCTGTLSSGSGSCILPVTQPGTGLNFRRVITATYGGDARFSGDTDTENHTVTPLPNNPPTAEFTPPTNCTAGQSCQFNDASTDGDGSVVTWSWNFGPGGAPASNDKNPNATFPTAGTFAVTLTVTDNGGATDDVTHQVTVNDPPSAGFIPPDCTAGVPCSFSDNSTDTDGTIVGWSWNFGPGGAPASNEEDPNATFPAAGTFDVTLTVTDDKGGTDSVMQPVNVFEP